MSALRLFTYGGVLLVGTRLFAGWPAYSALLERGGKYAYLCDEDHGSTMCPERRNALDNIAILHGAGELFGSVLAGFITSSYTPRQSGIIGFVLFGIYMIMTAVAGENSSVDLLPLAAIIGGLSINIIGFAALTLNRDFPESVGLCATFNSGMQNASTIMPRLILEVWERLLPMWSFANIWFAYAVLVCLPFGVSYAFTLPPEWGTIAQSEQKSSKEGDEVRDEQKAGEDVYLHRLMEAIFSVEFGMLIVVMIVLTLAGNYWPLVLSHIAGPEIDMHFGTMLPLAAVAGLGWGKVCDLIKTPPVVMALITIYLVVYLLSLSGPGPIHYLSTAIFIAAQSFTCNVKITYVTETFQPELHAALFGIAGALSGFSVPPLIILKKLWSVGFCCYMMSVSLCALYPIALAMWFRQAKTTAKRKSD